MSSRRHGAPDDKAYANNWEKIFGNKDEDPDDSDRDLGDDSPEDLCDETDSEGEAGWCTRPQIP